MTGRGNSMNAVGSARRRLPKGLAGVAGAVLLALIGVPHGGASAEPAAAAHTHQSRTLAVWPKDPSESWSIAMGGRLYDNWAAVQEIDLPKKTHPAYPRTSARKGGGTWRCKECHGWDYKGAAGAYASGSHYTGIKGVRSLADQPPAMIAAAIRGAPHNFDAKLLPDFLIEKLALFISKGQVETRDYIDYATGKAKGDATAGRGPFQNFCANCHGFDGRAMNFKTEEKPEFVGTIAKKAPWELVHKVINGHPGAPMPALRDFPASTLKNILAYTQTLPVK
ncbi:MAG: cytochrome c [Alphaproteobacteria bacterium]|nr:MAG: cytochrome c [Alphaproteobacteria bacterium]